ncbi:MULTISPECIES: hypothetical protein [unclassified Streptomyces]|uniref:hypothetical protein n=1 Tax=unclassified Streptomyces TaxID=2593676 RepID=UPI002E213552|nr:hypothetical protein OG217_35105 [Streptomyces sp. NBC_01023]
MRYSFPDDLLRAQADWYATYRQLAASAARQAGTAAPRRRLQQLSARIAAHPYWQTPPGNTPAARMALREAARDPAGARS